MIAQKREDSIHKIRQLGPLPTGLEQYAKASKSSLMHHLREANETLKKYSHVNKKALDQYLSFSEQRKQLLSRKEEMEKVEKDVCVWP